MKKHVYVDVSLAVERSNYMKQRARIIDGSNTRIERHMGQDFFLSQQSSFCAVQVYIIC